MPINIIPFFSLVSPTGLREEVLDELKIEDVRVLKSDDKIPLNEPIFIFIGTGGTERDVSEFLERNKVRSKITLLSYDERNSLPAAMEIRAYLQQRGITAKIIQKPLRELGTFLAIWNKYYEIRESLHATKIGVIGEPSSWLIASQVDPLKVKKKWGVKIQNIPIGRLIQNIPATLNEESERHIQSFVSGATIQNITEEAVRKAGLVAQRIRDIVKEENLSAVTVQCFTLLQETEISGCYSLALLNELEDIVAGCEGDIPATFTMLIAKMLTGNTSFMANVASIDQELNTAVFAHCTIPTGITEGYEITTHFETGLSMGIRGKLPLSEVTIVKVFGDDLSEYWVSGGTIIENLENDKRCRTQIRVVLDESVEYFLEESLANHHIVVLGDFVQTFEEFFESIY